ncbi:MAG: DUF433 domain-containing protein [Alphaproteobacteria bacterium]|nr:DUF433 domain-containing protein [Alphaproteobacteria bacterium]
MGGVPCLRGMRIPVATVIANVADGMTEAKMLAACPDLHREDIAGRWNLRTYGRLVRGP